MISGLFVNSVYIYFIISGNDAIHQLAIGRNSSLRVTITPMNGGVVSFKIYHQFYVFGEDQNYTLQVANPGSGSLGIWNHLLKLTASNYFSFKYLKKNNLIFDCPYICRAIIRLYMNFDNHCYSNIHKLLYNLRKIKLRGIFK